MRCGEEGNGEFLRGSSEDIWRNDNASARKMLPAGMKKPAEAGFQGIASYQSSLPMMPKICSRLTNRL
jgi:hypothetical protein